MKYKINLTIKILGIKRKLK